VGVAFSVLGHVSASIDGVEADLGAPKMRSVLALLLIHRGDVVSAERLVDSLWPDDAPATAYGTLQSYVSHLRRRLEPDRKPAADSILRHRAGGYLLAAKPDQVDASVFERLLQGAAQTGEPTRRRGMLVDALALWKGPAYGDQQGQPWAEAEIARLDGLRQVAREQLLDSRLACGESAVLVPELENLVSEQPLREERWRLLVLALYRSGRQADALASLRRARALLADELGVDPGPVLRALEAEVLSQSPSLDPPAAPTAPMNSPARREPSEPDVLVDRDYEVAALRTAFEGVLAGESRAVLVEGPAGIGKSRLLTELRRLATSSNAAVLAARGTEMEREFGFGVVRQLFEPALREPRRRARLFAGSAASAALVFDAEAQTSTEIAGLQAPRGDVSFAALHGLYWLTVNLAEETPLVLAVDDLHWCDTASLRFLGYLTHRLEGLPVLVAATVRTGEAHADDALLAELAHDPNTLVIRPTLLTFDGVGELVRTRLGGPADTAFVAACHQTTSGNPLLLRQLLRALDADGIRPDRAHADTVTAIGSRAISSMVLMRLRRLSTAAVTTARAVAVLGDGAELPAVAALTQLSEDDVSAAIATLVRIEIIRDEYPLGFVHPLVRDAIYRDLTPGERELQHERAAHVLAQSGATPEQVAAHLLQVPRRASQWVVDTLVEAAHRTADRGALPSAVAYLARALEEPPAPERRADLLLDLGWYEAFGDGPAAVEHLRAAYADLTDETRRQSAATTLARLLVFAGGRGEAAEFARRAASELPTEAADVRQGLLALERISRYMHGLDRQTWSDEAEPPISGDGPGALMLAAQVAWDITIAGGNRERAAELARFALRDGKLQRVDNGLLSIVAAVVLELADENIGSFWDDALADAHARGSMFAALAAHLWRGYHLWRAGDLREAEQSLLASMEQAEQWGNPTVGVPYGEAYTVGVLLDRGDIAGARRFVDNAPVRLRLGDGLRLFRESIARLLMAEGKPEEALAELDAIRDMQRGVVNPVWRPWRSLRAEALASLGRLNEAIELVRAELPLARTWGAPRLTGRTVWLLGELLERAGLDGRAEIREAVTLLAPTAARVDYARALLSLARLTPDGDRDPVLFEALDLAENSGADGLRAAIAAALRDAGHHVAAEPSGAVTLTTTERRIAEMVDGGADIRQIAQTLFLTPHTVEITLESVRNRVASSLDSSA
jgi:DNA-binding SARP family transcriptional activator/tetratricopeptide (TPR) repeat protein/DNA-binding CsgD family transcriptional regulator